MFRISDHQSIIKNLRPNHLRVLRGHRVTKKISSPISAICFRLSALSSPSAALHSILKN